MDKILAWHFLPNDRKLRYGDNRIAEPGVTHTVNCKPVLCESGLHASIKPLDALHYAPGPIVSQVEISGDLIIGDDKLAGTSRKYLWIADAEQTLNNYARWCALEVIHLWDAPEIVKRFLETGDESLRDAARGAAWCAAWCAGIHCETT